MLNFYRNCRTVFHSTCTILHSYQQCVKVPIASHPCQHSMWSVFRILAIPIRLWWYCFVSIFLLLMAFDVEHLFRCSLAICTSPRWGICWGSLPFKLSHEAVFLDRYLLTAVNWSVAPHKIMFTYESPEQVNVPLFGKRVFADVIKFRILRSWII